MSDNVSIRTERENRPDYIFVLIILAGMSVYYYGARAAVVIGVSVLSCCLTDFVCCKLRGCSSRASLADMGAVTTGLTLAMMMPASVRYTVLAGAAVLSIVIGRYIFTFKDGRIFNCAAIGFLMMALSFPDTVLMYPKPFVFPELANVVSVNLGQSLSKTLILTDDPSLTPLDLLTGQYYGPMGACHMLILLVCAVILVGRRAVSGLTLFSASAVLLTFTYFYHPYGRTPISGVLLTYCSGMLLFGLIFLVCDSSAVPKTRLARVIYGLLAGLFIVAFRFYGKAENAVVYAALAVSPLSGEIDRLTDNARELFSRLFRSKKNFPQQTAEKLLEDMPMMQFTIDGGDENER